MADKGNQGTPSSGGGAAVGFDQAEIDALLKDASGGQAATQDPAGSTPGEFSQSDIDEMLGGAAADSAGAAAPDDRVDSLGRPFDDMAAAMQAAIDEESAADAASRPAGFETKPFALPDFAGDGQGVEPHRVSMLHDVNLRVRVELGRTHMLVEDVLKLGEGSIVELEKLAGDPVDVYVNDRLLARGEVLVLNDSFCVRVSEVFTPDPHRVAT